MIKFAICLMQWDIQLETKLDKEHQMVEKKQERLIF